tara:strand:- start:1514 stop:1792 length:279 start_codon:yes stop_codon:yes gene_type:complete
MSAKAIAQQKRRAKELSTRKEVFYGFVRKGERQTLEKGNRTKRGPIPSLFKKRLTANIEPKLWKSFKDKLLQNNQTINEGLIDGIKFYLEKK